MWIECLLLASWFLSSKWDFVPQKFITARFFVAAWRARVELEASPLLEVLALAALFVFQDALPVLHLAPGNIDLDFNFCNSHFLFLQQIVVHHIRIVK
jgi:hypothetical protein